MPKKKTTTLTNCLLIWGQLSNGNIHHESVNITSKIGYNILYLLRFRKCNSAFIYLLQLVEFTESWY